MASLHDFKPLDEVTVDGRVYVDKEQLMALIKEEKRLSMEGTEPGYMMPKKQQRIAAMLALNRLSVLLRKREMDEMKAKDPYYLVAKLSEETGVLCYLSGYRLSVPDHIHELTPVFSENPNEAMRLMPEDARKRMIEINKRFPEMHTIPFPAWMTHYKHGLKVGHALLGWPEERHPEEILAEELSWTQDK